MKSLLITESLDILTGLRLAGIEGVYVKNKEELLKQFKSACNNKNLGIVILTESEFNEISDEVINIKLSNKLPLVVTIPERGGLKDKNFILRYVKDSVGIKID